MFLFCIHVYHPRTRSAYIFKGAKGVRRQRVSSNPQCTYSLLLLLDYSLNTEDVRVIVRNQLTDIVVAYVYTTEVPEFCLYVIQRPELTGVLEYIYTYWNGHDMYNNTSYYFYIACYCGNISVVRLIYDHVKTHCAFDIHYSCDQPLRASVTLSHIQVVRFLLERTQFSYKTISYCIKEAGVYKNSEICTLLTEYTNFTEYK